MLPNKAEEVCQPLVAESLCDEEEGHQNRWRSMLRPHQTATDVFHLPRAEWIIHDAHFPGYDC